MSKPLLIADLFCGAGGSSTGAMRAVKTLGREMILVCVNHWPLAIETHQANHPSARHYIEDITAADPVKLVPEGYLDLLMASPECTHFSRARGGKPVNNQSRMNPWAILMWLTKLEVRTVLIENVPEFRDWGPVDANDQPIKEMKGIFFEACIEAIKRCGYKLDYTILNCADYGDATTRKRFFLIARKDKKPVTFPKPTHSKNGGSGLKKWRAAREIIDWNNPGRSLLDHPKYIKHPLSVNTRRRIAAGFRKQGGALAAYFIRLLDIEPDGGGSGWPEGFTFNNRQHSTARDMGQPIHGVTASWNGGNGLVQPEIKPFTFASRFDNTPHDVKDPVPTITNRKLINLVEAKIEPMVMGQQSCSAARTPDKPIPTVATGGAISLTRPELVVFHGTSKTSEVDAPMPCQPTKSKLGLMNPQLVKYYSNEKESLSVEDPLDTVTTKDRFGLVESVIVQTDQTGSKGNCVRPVDNPMPTLVTKANAGLAIAEAVIFPVGHGKKDMPNPRTLDINEPAPAMTTHRHIGLAQKQAEPTTIQDVDPRRLVWIDGILYKLDILFRMLTNAELAASHSFNSEEHKYEFKGTVAEITKQIGNSVPCGTAAALVGEILR
ncbi:MAG: DNA cytosine methyltransferase [Dehalococcoidales bacterium]|nr:DNA cytosine methyltransferase [Dehalococcoidales bacterium]